MSDPVKPLILFLDPDQDFLSDMETEAKSRAVKILKHPYSSRESLDIEQLIFKHYPDIVVVNLDQTPDQDFGSAVTTILKTPTPLTPIILGTTNKDSLSLKTRVYQIGIDDYLVRPFSPKEVWLRIDVLLRTRRLQRQLDNATRSLSMLNRDLNNSNRHLEEMTLTDELTGLNNMRFVSQFLEKQFHVFIRFHRSFSVLMIDLDHFKEVNDQNDHLVGSETIRAIGHIIGENTRGGDVKARYGGDEYVIAMPETNSEGAKIVAERIRLAVEAHKIIGNENRLFRVTASIGVASFDKKIHNKYQDVIRDADYAMYMAKKSGRNQTVVFDESLKKAQMADYDSSKSAVMTELEKLKD